MVCELCGTAVSDDYVYKVSAPRELVGKVLPLMKTSLAVVGAVNRVAKLGSFFGVPSLDSSCIKDADAYWSRLGKNDMKDFPSLEQRVWEAYRDPVDIGGANNAGSTAIGCDRDPLTSSLRDQGYCVRQFRSWLFQVDPNRRWMEVLEPRMHNDMVCFVCAGGCSEKTES